MAEVITRFAFYPVRRFFCCFFLIGCQIQRFQRRTKSVRSAVTICLCKYVLFIFSLLCGNSEDLTFPQLFLLRRVLCRVLAPLRLPAASVRRLGGVPPPRPGPRLQRDGSAAAAALTSPSLAEEAWQPTKALLSGGGGGALPGTAARGSAKRSCE